MLRRCLPALAMLVVSVPSFAASGLDLNINDKAARITLDFELTNNLVADASWLHHQDRGNVVGAGLHVTGAATGGRNPLRAGLGGRLIAADAKVGARDDGMALPIGGFVNYTLPDYDRFVLGGSVYYAPDVLAFGDLTKYLEYNAWAGYSVLRQGQIYIGARRVRGSFKEGPGVTFDTGLHFGLRLRF
jgi:hypothetical protein